MSILAYILGFSVKYFFQLFKPIYAYFDKRSHLKIAIDLVHLICYLLIKV